jgi:hypothetical protein
LRFLCLYHSHAKGTITTSKAMLPPTPAAIAVVWMSAGEVSGTSVELKVEVVSVVVVAVVVSAATFVVVTICAKEVVVVVDKVRVGHGDGNILHVQNAGLVVQLRQFSSSWHAPPVSGKAGTAPERKFFCKNLRNVMERRESDCKL